MGCQKLAGAMRSNAAKRHNQCWRSSDRGFALVVVLVAVAILILLAQGVVSISNQARRDSTAVVQSVKAVALAQAAINDAILVLLGHSTEKARRLNDGPYQFTFDAVTMAVELQDEIGRVDLNKASAARLAVLLRSVGVTQELTQPLANSIVSWREAKAGHRLNEVLADDAYTDKSHLVPRHGPFPRLDELLLVPGMTMDLYQHLKPILTVFSYRDMVNVMLAPPAVLRTFLPSESAVVAMIEARKRNAMQSDIDEQIDTTNGSLSAGATYRIRVRVPLGRVQPYDYEETVTLTGDPSRPYLVRDWHNVEVGATN